MRILAPCPIVLFPGTGLFAEQRGEERERGTMGISCDALCCQVPLFLLLLSSGVGVLAGSLVPALLPRPCSPEVTRSILGLALRPGQESKRNRGRGRLIFLLIR